MTKMQFKRKYNKFLKEDISLKEKCNLCKESILDIGEKGEYGAVIIYKIGATSKDSWFATLSPKTGGNPVEDFTVQLMPYSHLTHFAQLEKYPKLAKNYGIAFSKISNAVTKLISKENSRFDYISDSREDASSIATYGKSTNWKDKKEHLHIKIFPFRGNMGQPFTVDSSFEKKEVFKDQKTNEEFIKMTPIKKVNIHKERFEELSKQFIELLK